MRNFRRWATGAAVAVAVAGMVGAAAPAQAITIVKTTISIAAFQAALGLKTGSKLYFKNATQVFPGLGRVKIFLNKKTGQVVIRTILQNPAKPITTLASFQTVGQTADGKKVSLASKPTINPITGEVTSISIPNPRGGDVVVSPS
jgi:hypothetical protein